MNGRGTRHPTAGCLVVAGLLVGVLLAVLAAARGCP